MPSRKGLCVFVVSFLFSFSEYRIHSCSHLFRCKGGSTITLYLITPYSDMQREAVDG